MGVTDNSTKVSIERIQFKRGEKSALEAYLVGDRIPKNGEPIFETDTNRMKFGDGVRAYVDLPYFNVSTAMNFSITLPKAENALIYNSATASWENKSLYDGKSITRDVISDAGLTLVGYGAASEGQMPVKGANGLVWVDPLTESTLSQYVTHASSASQSASNASASANTYAAKTAASAIRAEKARDETIEAVNNKFWWGSPDEYNALTEIMEGTIYFLIE